MTPSSEFEITFSVSSDDNDSERSGSASLSSKPSLGSLRAAASGAIGSERKEMERVRSRNSSYQLASSRSSSEDVSIIGGKLGDFKLEGKAASDERRKTLLVGLTSAAEKRKSSIF